jgi:cytochrome c556
MRPEGREAARLAEVRDRPERFGPWLADAEAAARELESVLRARKDKGVVNVAAAEKAFRITGQSCTHCHARYRDVPRTP